MKLEIVKADITKQNVDAIVNAANSRLANGGGVAKAIRLAAGPEYQRECDQLAAKELVPTGEAVVTGAGSLPCRYVINAVGPIYGKNAGRDAELLTAAYVSSLQAAMEWDITSIAFPAISCGIYGYPLQEGAEIAVSSVLMAAEQSPQLELIRFCLFGDRELEAFETAACHLTA